MTRDRSAMRQAGSFLREAEENDMNSSLTRLRRYTSSHCVLRSHCKVRRDPQYAPDVYFLIPEAGHNSAIDADLEGYLDFMSYGGKTIALTKIQHRTVNPFPVSKVAGFDSDYSS